MSKKFKFNGKKKCMLGVSNGFVEKYVNSIDRFPFINVNVVFIENYL